MPTELTAVPTSVSPIYETFLVSFIFVSAAQVSESKCFFVDYKGGQNEEWKTAIKDVPDLGVPIDRYFSSSVVFFVQLT